MESLGLFEGNLVSSLSAVRELSPNISFFLYPSQGSACCPVQPAVGDPAAAGGLDQMTHRGPFQPRTFCDSVMLSGDGRVISV